MKNLGRGNDFSAFERSTAHAVSTEIGALVMELPALHGPTMRKVDQGNLSFWAAANSRKSGLGLMDRRRVKV